MTLGRPPVVAICQAYPLIQIDSQDITARDRCFCTPLLPKTTWHRIKNSGKSIQTVSAIGDVLNLLVDHSYIRKVDTEAFCFPMRDDNSIIIGIRRRFGNGKKVCVVGSQNGLFIPAGIENASKLVICERPTDCAAALDTACGIRSGRCWRRRVCIPRRHRN